MNKKEKDRTVRNRLYTSILLVLLAFVAVTAATVAWFSIADRAKVKTMSLDIIADADMRMDLDPHSTIDQYVKTLSFEQIAERIRSILDAVSHTLTEEERAAFYRSLSAISRSLDTIAQNSEA